ncbi:5'-methylthioadenosine/S-adenosylhomocysteine nucleosidase [uncultured Slackia sp.]|uniref:5'-methylthioadenosine/S-adenosylhomocysteine nucleosidase n=1 Tax=uncultured Slackia sp. TaxID=665903 RepID=UPI0025EA1D17|nr:5'-methylthioadenosine/S-adenosylhomocysteine nucleosidase [uncultured Slackia sp.]
MISVETASSASIVQGEGAVKDVESGRLHSGVCDAEPSEPLGAARCMKGGMSFGILTATWGETVPFLRHMKVEREVRRGPRSFFEGELAGCDVVVACAGVGKVNAAMATQQLIDSYRVWGVANAGAAGAADASLELFDVVVSETCVHHDVPGFVLPDSYPYYDGEEFASDGVLLEAAKKASAKWRKPFAFGRTATGECFVDDSNRDGIVARCNPLAVDMETAAMAQTCTANGIPFIAVRCITDTPALSGFDSYAQNADEASEYACQATQLMLRVLAGGE